MRIAPNIHKEEIFTKRTRISYINEVPMCSNCDGVNLKQRTMTNQLHMMKQKYECLGCKMVYPEQSKYCRMSFTKDIWRGYLET